MNFYNTLFDNNQFSTAIDNALAFVPGGSAIGGLIKPAGFDNMIDSIGLGKLFGQTSATAFLNDGEAKMKKMFSSLLPINPNNAESQINEILYHLHFLKKHYKINLDNSKSKRAIDGNKESLKDVNETIAKFLKNISSTGFNVKSKTNKSVVFKKNNNVLGWFSGKDEQGIVPYVTVEKTNVNVSAKTDFLPNNNLDNNQNFAENKKGAPIKKDSENNNTLILLGLGVFMFWGKIKKALR
jgi:hypothetical protein